MDKELMGKLFALKEFVNTVNETEIKFLCNDCLQKNNQLVPPTWYYHDTGRCEDCGRTHDVSVPVLNKKANDLGLVIDETLVVNGEAGRNVFWTDRIYDLKRKRYESAAVNGYYLGKPSRAVSDFRNEEELVQKYHLMYKSKLGFRPMVGLEDGDNTFRNLRKKGVKKGTVSNSKGDEYVFYLDNKNDRTPMARLIRSPFERILFLVIIILFKK